MKDVKKALFVCYSIQGGIVIFLIVNVIFANFNIEILRIRVWFIPIVYFSNFLICSRIFFKSLKNVLKKISPDIIGAF